MREKERDLANIEMKETFAKQDLSRDLKDRDDTIKRASEDFQLSKLQEERAREEAEILRTEVAQLKGIIEEGDRSREILVRELARQKEQENERIRENDARKDAEVKLQERFN